MATISNKPNQFITDHLPESDQKKAEQSDVTQEIEVGSFASLTAVFQAYLAEAWQGNPDAQFQVGMMLLNGEGVAQNDAQAFHWLCKAANQENTAAQLHVGLMYYYGQGVAENNEEAFVWLRKAADNGDIEAQARIGVLYVHEGLGATQLSDELVLNWIKQAAETGRIAVAQYALGRCYSQGSLGLPANPTLAKQWYAAAAAQGCPSAADELARLKDS